MKKIRRTAIVGMGALGLLYGEQIMDAFGYEAVSFLMDEERFKRHKEDVYTINGKVMHFNVTRVSDTHDLFLSSVLKLILIMSNVVQVSVITSYFLYILKKKPPVRAVRGATRTRAKLPIRVLTASDATNGLFRTSIGSLP